MPGPMGHGPGARGAAEKPQDFNAVMGKLAHYSKRYLPAIIIALVLGAFGTVCQIVGPDKLKDITNEITKGLPAIVDGRPVLNSIDLDAVTGFIGAGLIVAVPLIIAALNPADTRFGKGA